MDDDLGTYRLKSLAFLTIAFLKAELGSGGPETEAYGLTTAPEVLMRVLYGAFVLIPPDALDVPAIFPFLVAAMVEVILNGMELFVHNRSR